ncbi:MAG: polysaccharide export protein [Candidatus Omnitrophica bacterium]|nr:polysaccharide export protein [Candidatus Omnitrophota bacterium]MDD5653349.1 polysaccharide export protein [Candidatus Omnitrophota bacterium]
MKSKISLVGICTLVFMLIFYCLARAAEQEDLKVIDTTAAATLTQEAPGKEAVAGAQPETNLVKAEPAVDTSKYMDPTKYTLGPDDVVDISVLRHQEFSGVYPVNQEGKIQYKFVGDLEVTGMTKTQLEAKIKEIISSYVINPEVNVTITEFKSKVIYILGEVGQPGKFYMRSESIPVREAVVQAGLPTLAAAMRRCLLITPDKSGKPKSRPVDLYAVLYGGDLKKNVEMVPGEVLYVPATVMAKIVRVISPVTQTVGVAASGPNEAQTGRSAVTSLVTK